MDPTKLLEADHRQVEALFEAIDKASGDDRRPLIDELVTSVRAHMELEEKVLYPAMGPVTGKEAVEEGNTEHELARKSLQDMVDLAPDEPGFGLALEATKAGISHHVEEEEGEIFPELRKDGTVLDQIATPFMTTPTRARTARRRRRPGRLVDKGRAARRGQLRRHRGRRVHEQGRAGRGPRGGDGRRLTVCWSRPPKPDGRDRRLASLGPWPRRSSSSLVRPEPARRR